MAGENNTYRSKYFTAEEIDQRLLQGYYDDAVQAGYQGTKAQFLNSLVEFLDSFEILQREIDKTNAVTGIEFVNSLTTALGVITAEGTIGSTSYLVHTESFEGGVTVIINNNDVYTISEAFRVKDGINEMIPVNSSRLQTERGYTYQLNISKIDKGAFTSAELDGIVSTYNYETINFIIDKIIQANIAKSSLDYENSGFRSQEGKLTFHKQNLLGEVIIDDIPAATTESAGVMTADDKRYTLFNIDKTVTLVSITAFQSLNLGYIIPKGASVHIEGDFNTISCRTNSGDDDYQTITGDGIADRDITHIKMQGVGTATMTIKGVILQKVESNSGAIAKNTDDLQTLKIGGCYILESNLVSYPARRNGTPLISSEDFKGYEIDLEEAYINGYRYIKVRTSTRTVQDSDIGILPAIVLDKTGVVESLIETEADKIKTTAWYTLPITENSKTLRATYADGKTYPDTKLVPYKYELLTELPPQVVDYSNDIENLNNEVTDLKKAEGLDIYLIPGKYPARKDGSTGSSGTYKGYEVNIEDAFAKGFRFIKVRAASYGTASNDNSIVPCLVYDKNGNVESVITEFETYSTAWYILPITENSSKVKCSYAEEPYASHNEIVFKPYKYELLTDNDVNERFSDIEETLENLEETLENVGSPINGVEIFLPPEIYILKGRMTQLFFRGFIKAVDPYVYDIKVQCAVGKTYKRYYEIEHNTTGDFPLKIEVRDDNKRVLGVAETTIKIIEPTSISSKNILCCGASATETGHWAAELKRLLTTGSEKYNGLNLPMTFVGRKVGSSDKSVQLEATGGWSWGTFISAGVPAVRFYVTGMTGNIGIGTKLTLNDAEKGTLHYSVLEVNLTEGVGNIRCGEVWPNPVVLPSSTLGTLIGDSISITYKDAIEERFTPFYNAETEEVDFKTYADNYCNGNIDILVAHMGVNSVLAENSPTPTTSIKAFLDGYFRDFPNSKVLVSAIPFPDYGTNIYTNTYKENNTNRYGSLCSFFDYNKNLYEISQLGEYKGKVIYCPSNVFFDTDYGYPKTNKNVNNRITSIKESIDTNGVHPIKEGSYMISDSILPTIITL